MTTLICTVLFCLGWRMVTDDGQLLYFIREFFKDCETDNEHLESTIAFSPKENYRKIETKIFINKALILFGTPFVLCITCMSSIWGITVFYFYHIVTLQAFGQYWFLELAFNCIAASFIQTLIWKLYVKLV